MTPRSGGQRIHLDSAILSRIAELRPVQLRAHVACVAWFASDAPEGWTDLEEYKAEYRHDQPIEPDRLCRALVRCGIGEKDAERITKMPNKEAEDKAAKRKAAIRDATRRWRMKSE
jgi:hypothetical protein